MKTKALCLTLVLAAALVAATEAQSPALVYTSVTLTELDCMGCAKSVAKKMAAVPGVAETRINFKARTLFAIHKSGTAPSPRALWEAVEEADHTPERITTPAGSFTAKPAS